MATMEGPLSKWTNVMKGWQYRWFVLDETSGILSYYTSKEKMMRGSRRGCVRLKGAVIGIDDEDDSTFTITVDQKTFHFQARDAEERERWIVALENTILRHSSQQKRQEIKHIPTLTEFDEKLAETDAYLQLLIDQVQDLQHRIDDCEDSSAKEKITVIKVTAEAMIEAIKHSIVMLQISKESLRETVVNGTPHEPPISSIGDHGHFSNSRKSNTTTRSTSPLSQVTTSISSDNIDSAVDVSKIINGVIQSSSSLPSLPVSRLGDSSDHDPIDGAVGITENSVIPPTSYSSSEDEDFFDAEEYGVRSAKSSPEKRIVQDQNIDELDSKLGSQTDITPKIIASEDDYFDELYDETEKEDLGSMEKHGSIIAHLLSQVRIGMDLTKVVLPTFILERRSLLEMYADFFAHPDLFVRIADLESPKDRMVQLVRWYLSAFHAGRNSEIAKKPYNPILGETFSCFYDIPDCDKTADLVEDGPISGVTKNNLAFIAEQVSHHPPISAFYAEHYSKKITLDGYIWTKSKFLGLSIGVHMIGQAVVSVIDKDEEYIFTFPNGYGRSILTVPWVELGGKVNISCAKTGYSANVEFHTKPFYGGKKHRMSAEILLPNDKKPFCTIEGEWNGVMYAKYSTGMNEAFVDTKRLPIVKKKIKPRDQQGEFESRRLWQDCTYNLKYNNIADATRAKHKLEQRQREEAKERKEHGIKWETKHFHEVGENWVYDRPLIKRLGKTVNTPPGTL